MNTKFALKLTLLCLLVFPSFVLPAQAASIKGRVLTTANGPVSFAYVYIEGKNYATQCDGDGCFELRVPEGKYTLTAACMGYEKNTATASSGDTGVVIVLRSSTLLDAVTVTATRTPKTLANTPVVTRVISAEDIRQTDATNIKDLLENELPGVEFTYSMNQQVSIKLQGMGGMSVLFLVDGERLAGETLDNTDFARLNMDNIERIEIIKGAATALYGSNAVGAVVNIITRVPDEPWTAQVNTRVGSRHGQYRHGANVGFNKGKWGNLLNIQTDGIDSYTVYDKDGDSTLVYGNRQWNFKDKLTYRVNDHSNLTARAGYYFHERDESPTLKDRARAFSGGVRYSNQLSDDDNLMVSYSFERYDKSDYYPVYVKEYLDYKNVQNTVRLLYSHTFSENLTLSSGGDAMNDYLMSYQFSADEDHHQQQTADLFAQADWDITNNLNVVAGVRMDYFSKYGTEFTPKLAAMYKTGNMRFRGSYSKGFRAPTLKEMYMDFNMANIFTIYGNENLESEVSHCLTASAEYVRNRFSATLTGYYNMMENEITTVWDASRGAAGAMVYRNVEGTNIGSIDVSVTARSAFGLTTKLSYTYFHEFPRNEDYNLSDTRPHSLVVQLIYAKTMRSHELTASLNGRCMSAAKYYVLDNSSTGVYDSYTEYKSVGYTMWKLSLSDRIKNSLTITLGVDNLLGYKPSEYEYNLPYTAGRTFLVGLSLDIHHASNWVKKN